MNRLRAGAVLRIPGGDEVAAVSPTEARDEVRRSDGLLVCLEWSGSAATPASGPPSDSAIEPGRDTR